MFKFLALTAAVLLVAACARTNVSSFTDPSRTQAEKYTSVPVRVFGVVPKMSLTPGRIWGGAPAIGDDTTDILSTMLGLSEAEIDGLYADEAVHRTEPFTMPQVASANP